MHTALTRSYRCYYHPRPDQPAECGVLPHVQIKAASAEDAMKRAYAVLDKPIDRVERLEPNTELRAALETIRTADTVGRTAREAQVPPPGVRYAAELG